jgi:hypothetical protein
MVKLTKEEFCLFNLKSKIQLVNKDGYFLNRRIVGDSYLISLYHLYNFYVEATYDISSVKTLGIDPVVNIQVIELYEKLIMKADS